MDGWDIILAFAVCVVAGLSFLRIVACAIEAADGTAQGLEERFRRERRAQES